MLQLLQTSTRGGGVGQVMLVHLGKKSKVAVFRWPRFHSAYQVFGGTHLCGTRPVAERDCTIAPVVCTLLRLCTGTCITNQSGFLIL